MTATDFFEIQNTVMTHPLTVVEANYDRINLHLRGPDWNFNALAPWRVYTEEGVNIGSEDEEASKVIENLKGQKIICAEYLWGPPFLDPCFKFSNGARLFVFTTCAIDPWALGLQDRVIVGGY